MKKPHIVLLAAIVGIAMLAPGGTVVAAAQTNDAPRVAAARYAQTVRLAGMEFVLQPGWLANAENDTSSVIFTAPEGALLYATVQPTAQDCALTGDDLQDLLQAHNGQLETSGIIGNIEYSVLSADASPERELIVARYTYETYFEEDVYKMETLACWYACNGLLYRFEINHSGGLTPQDVADFDDIIASVRAVQTA